MCIYSTKILGGGKNNLGVVRCSKWTPIYLSIYMYVYINPPFLYEQGGSTKGKKSKVLN
jgi:hypothetical protein